MGRYSGLTYTHPRGRQVMSGGPGDSTFTPTQLAGLTLWLDASQITGKTDGATITTWTDLSSQALAYGGTATYYKTTAAKLINGLPAVWFDGATNHVANNSPPVLVGADGTWTAYVAAIASDVSSTLILLDQANSSYTASYLRCAAGVYEAIPIDAGGTAHTASAGSSVAAGARHTVGGIVTASQVVVRLDGIAGTAVSVPSLNERANLAVVGGHFNSSSYTNLWNGALGEAMVYSRALNSTEQGQVEAYLKAKWGTP